MSDFDSPAYVFDFRDRRNCSRVENAKPGKEIKVLVHPEGNTRGTSVSAKGKLSHDGQSFDITVTTDAGEQTHTWTYAFLLDAIRVHGGHAS